MQCNFHKFYPVANLVCYKMAEFLAAAALYGGVVWFFYWLDGPRRRPLHPNDISAGLPADAKFFYSSSLTDEDLAEIDLNVSVLNDMEPEDREKYVDAKLKSLKIAKNGKVLKAKRDCTTNKSEESSKNERTSEVESCEAVCELNACVDDPDRSTASKTEDDRVTTADLALVGNLGVRTSTEKIDPKTTQC